MADIYLMFNSHGLVRHKASIAGKVKLEDLTLQIVTGKIASWYSNLVS